MGAARTTPYTPFPSMRGMLLNTIYTMMLVWLIWSQQYANGATPDREVPLVLHGPGASSNMGYARPNIRKIKWSREALVIQDAQYTSNHSESRAISNHRQLIDSCSKADITILQGQSSPMPSGIPTFSVQIFNMCVAAGCSISNIHIACGWFASAKLVNPSIFRRIKYNDCLVNNGAPIRGGESISFQYSNSFEYPLTVLSISTCH